MGVTSKFPGYSRREIFPWPKRGEILALGVTYSRLTYPRVCSVLGLSYARVNLRDTVTT